MNARKIIEDASDDELDAELDSRIDYVSKQTPSFEFLFDFMTALWEESVSRKLELVTTVVSGNYTVDDGGLRHLEIKVNRRDAIPTTTIATVTIRQNEFPAITSDPEFKFDVTKLPHFQAEKFFEFLDSKYFIVAHGRKPVSHPHHL